MPRRVLRAPRTFEAAYDQVRDELDVPATFPFDVLSEAAEVEPPAFDRVDARDLPLVAVDPPGATDLDQAFHADRRGGGFRVFYAIADVAPFVVPGGLVDAEARRRGTTLYSPDQRAPLHPRIISEDRASLLPGGDKPALLWTIDLDEGGEPVEWRLERAMVHVSDAISYHEAQHVIDTGGDEALGLLRTIGVLRRQREADRGGVSLNLPPQEVVVDDGSYGLRFDVGLPVEGWNAQISLLTGMVAARTMTDAGVGILRTLPPPDPDEIARLRRTAHALGLDWPAGTSYADYVRDLTPTEPRISAFLAQCTRVFRGAGYLSFAGEVPAQDQSEHGAIAARYAHVTAPLRRLVDRFGNEILLAAFAEVDPPGWAVEALDELPSLMGRARQRESALERAMVDVTEAVVLAPNVGETFDGTVIDVDDGSRARSRARVQIDEPAIVADIPFNDSAAPVLGGPIKVRLDAVDVDQRRLQFTPVA